MEVVASLSQGRTAAAQCGLFTHKSVPVIFEPPFTYRILFRKCVGMESENRYEDKWILVKYSVRMCTGFSCLNILNIVIKLWVL